MSFIVRVGRPRVHPNTARRDRRRLLRMTAGLMVAGACAPFVGAAAAAERNKAGFSANTAAEAMKSIGATNPTPSKDIVLKAPDVAENGALVAIEVTSRIPNTEAISIIADKNPAPLIATFEFGAGVEPYISTRIKLMESSDLRVVVMAGGRYYQSVREVRVTQGGCA